MTNFTRREFACKCGCGFDTVDSELLSTLQKVREYYGCPVIISSGCRCPEHNGHVGGSDRSQHLYGRAADFVVQGVNASEVQEYLEREYPTRYGIGRYAGWTHLDTRTGPAARWSG